MFIEWPSLLNGTTPLQLITVGTVVRCNEIGISVVFESYQFRTMSRTRQANIAQMPEPVSQAFGNRPSESLTLSAKSSN